MATIEVEGKKYKVTENRLIRVFIARTRANFRCLLHFGQCVLTHEIKKPGSLVMRTERIETGTGSILRGTWKTARVFCVEKPLPPVA